MKCISESRKLGAFNFVFFSILGICMFFLPVVANTGTMGLNLHPVSRT